MPSNHQPLHPTNTVTIQSLADVLRRHNYTPYALFAALGEDHGTTLNRVDLPVYLRRLTDSPLHNLIRLFLLGVSVEREALAIALAPLAPDALLALGLAQEKDGAFTSPYRVTAFAEMYFVSDRFLIGDILRPDFVTGVNNTTINLAALTIRRSGRALDIGTGCGVQALLASAHCEQVIATDINPRALEMARFNAALNRATNIEWRLGNFFEPVAGAEFDLIMCNPPYVISPQTDYIFRNAGLRGDAVSRAIVTQAAHYLREGGFAIVLCDWIHTSQEKWWAPLEAWVAQSKCDALCLCHRTIDPLNYAAGWTRQPAPPDETILGQQLDEWLAYYNELGIHSISGGAIILRRSAGPNWMHAEMISTSPRDASGTHIQRMFVAQDYLRILPNDDALLDAVIAPLDGRIDQTLKFRDGEWRADGMRWRMPHGLEFDGELAAFDIHLLTLLDGRQPLRILIKQAAQNASVDLDAVTGDALQMVRRWIEVGFVEPVK